MRKIWNTETAIQTKNLKKGLKIAKKIKSMTWKRSRFSVLSPSILKSLISAESKKKIKNVLQRKIKQSFRGNFSLQSVLFLSIKNKGGPFRNSRTTFSILKRTTEEGQVSQLHQRDFVNSRIIREKLFQQIHEQKKAKKAICLLFFLVTYEVNPLKFFVTVVSSLSRYYYWIYRLTLHRKLY